MRKSTTAASRKAESLPFSHTPHKNCELQKLPEKFPATQKSPGSSVVPQDSTAPTNSVPAEPAVPGRPAVVARFLSPPSAEVAWCREARRHSLRAPSGVPVAPCSLPAHETL